MDGIKAPSKECCLYAGNMEPMTHFLTGACLARAGINRKAAYATLAMTLAAEMPDLDMLWRIKGPIAEFQHHRGITHTLLGIPFEAAIVVGVIWSLHRWRTRRGHTTIAPVNWPLLGVGCCLALLSHIFLDWTNNYGVRPFFPFNPHWYAGSFVFIFEPVLFAILIVALGAPSLFALIGSEVGARRQRFHGRSWAICGLCAMATLWSWRAFEHSKAIDLAAAGDYAGNGVRTGTANGSSVGSADGISTGSADIRRVFASPEPINPYRWHIVVDTPMFYQLGLADTLSGTLTTTPEDLLYKPPTTIATLPAKRTWLGEAYLDWSSWPLVDDIGLDGNGFTEITFRDIRFMYDTSFLRGRHHVPLSGIVYLDADRRLAAMELNGNQQH